MSVDRADPGGVEPGPGVPGTPPATYDRPHGTSGRAPREAVEQLLEAWRGETRAGAVYELIGLVPA